MRKVLRVASIALVVLLVASPAFASQTTGFAAYKVSVMTPMGIHSALVNESVGPSGKAGYADLILQIFGGTQNLTYSKLVNDSDVYFPYLPNVNSQSFHYSKGTYGVQVNVTSSGTTTAQFKGNQYTLNVMAVSIKASNGSKSVMMAGTVKTFPSTLVYSAAVGNGIENLQVVLQATNLPLTTAAPQMSTAAYVGAGVGIGALALGGVLFVARRGKKVEKEKEKPLHWVD